MLTATGTFPTTDAPRYVKQLASHLGRRAEVREEPDRTVLVFMFGECGLHPTAESVELSATASDEDGLATVRRVVGDHLERFAQRHDIKVVWQA